MKKVIYSKLSRDRKEEFQILTSIIEEDGKKYVIKTSGVAAAKKHIQSMKENSEILKTVYGDSINIISCELTDENTARFEYIEGENLTQKIIELYRGKSLNKAVNLISGIFTIIESKAVQTFKVTDCFKEVFGEFDYTKSLKATVPACIDCYFNNIIIDETGKMNLIDYEWMFDFPVPVNYIFYRSIQMLGFDTAIDRDFISRLFDVFGIDEEQISVFGKMENYFMSYARSSSTPVTLYDYHIKLGRSCVNYDLNYLAMNNPKVFPDYGNGYSETTKRTCIDFDFRSGYLNTKVIFDAVPERIRFDPVDGLYCLVSEIIVKAGETELPVSWHNGSDFNGVILFDSIDSNIYYENSEGAREFTIIAKIFGFNDEMMLKAFKYAQSMKFDFDRLQSQAVETYNQYVESQKQLEVTQNQLSEKENQLEVTQNQLSEKENQLEVTQNQLSEKENQLSEIQYEATSMKIEIQNVSIQKEEALCHAENMRISAEQWCEAYKSISNSKFWKITFPLRKISDSVKSILKKRVDE